ncbi:WD repeat-containing protein 43-like [Morus notabilis]|nr:WD repeat-containing protein 43-like [Morus notabilis]
MDLEATVLPKKSEKRKKHTVSELEHSTLGDMIDIGNGEAAVGVLLDDDDLNEPTMGEKLATLNLDIAKRNENDESSLAAKPPSADSVHVLLKQAMHADDRALLLDCLYTQDEKVIAKSISLLNPSDVLKLLQSLISIIQSRGAILACALPWLRCLLLQHSSGIMSQESSLVALNSLYQLIESRVSTFRSALQLSSVLDVLYAGIVDDEVDESDAIVPVIIEDKDESDEEESEDAMETDESSEDDEASDEAFGGLGDLEGDNDMSE